MRLSLLFLLLLLFLSWPQSLLSQTIRVAVIPMTRFSQEDLSALDKPLTDMLVKGLQQQGFKAVVGSRAEVPELAKAEPDDALARRIGKDLQTDFVIYGSLSKIGEQISLDVRLVDVANIRPTATIFVTRTGMEGLAGGVGELTSEIGIRIFRKKRINEILVAGNQRIETEAIKLMIKSKKGDIFDPGKLREDLTAIYKMGYFQDVSIEAEDTPQGQNVSFVVKEKPTVSTVTIRGADAVKEDDIFAAISTSKYGILQRSSLQSDVEKIRILYHDKGYYNVDVTYDIKSLEHNSAEVTFQIEEHKKLYILKITFSGNQQYSDDDLEDVIKTSEKGLFSYFTDSGILKREDLEVDVDRLAAFYHTRGFVDARVGRPVITHDEKGIYIDFPIVEGQRFRVGKVEVAGEDVEAEPKLIASLKLADEEFFNREVLARDLERVADFYTAQGYAFAEVVPRIGKDESSQVVNVIYEVHKGELVNFERITISGNTKTRDKVIRRELQVVEGARYSKSRLQRSESNLRRLDYFELVEMETSKADEPDRMNLDVKVQEKPTRFISIGGGFSSADQLFAMAQIAERNLFGRGQTLQFQGQFGTVASRFSLTFTEPWLFDIPLSSTVEAYNWARDYDEFNKESLGGKLAFGYPVWNYTRAYLSYVYDDSKVSNVADNASTFIKDQEGRIVSSVISTTLRRDSRDQTFLTTSGSDNSLTLEYAGGVLGGDSAFLKGIFNSSWYYPLFWKFVGFLHGKYGIIEGLSDGITPIYERFFLGGINSLRGWDSGDVSPRDPETGDRIGGETMILFNAEILWPLVEKIGLRGLVFYDAGNSYLRPEDLDMGDLKMDVGAGIRWHSPMGPLRLEYGYKLNPVSGESRGNFQFSMGVFF